MKLQALVRVLRAAGMAKRLRRARPYAMVSLAAVLIAWLPTGNEQSTDVGFTPDGYRAADDPAGLGPDGIADGLPQGPLDAQGAGGPDGGGAQGQGNPSGAGGPGTGPGPGGGAPSAGIGTPEALAAADCDRSSGKLKISFTYRPPCVVPWAQGANNGGTTAGGVTATSIKVVQYYTPPNTGAQSDEQLKAMYGRSLQAFEHFYRLWGRKVELAIFRGPPPDPNNTVDAVGQRADAIKIADMKPFAVVGLMPQHSILRTELATKGIVTIGSFLPVELSLQLAPYAYGSGGVPDRAVQVNAADYVGRRLLGKHARWAGDATYRGIPRKFGIVYPGDGGSAMDLKAFTDVFAKYGGTLTDAYAYSTQSREAQANDAGVIAGRFKDKGVTSVIALTDVNFTQTLTTWATTQRYYPEWVITGYASQDANGGAQNFDKVQWAQAFGIGTAGLTTPAAGPVPFPQAWFFKWYWGDATNFAQAFTNDAFVLYTGIHGAGPALTPRTFRDGVFALGPAGGAATKGPAATTQVSFGRGVFPWDDYAGSDDFDEIYWDPNASVPSPFGPVQGRTQGAYRHLNGGKRTAMSQWPTGEPAFFNADGTVTVMSAYPAGDEPPSFPCTNCPSQGG